MFGIDGPEFLVILIVLIVVVGPKDLPKMLRAFGKATARMRATAYEFRKQFDEAMHEAELDDLQKTVSDLQKLDPRRNLTQIFDPIRDVAKDVRDSIQLSNSDELENQATTQILNPPDDVVAGQTSKSGKQAIDLSSSLPNPALTNNQTRAESQPINAEAVTEDGNKQTAAAADMQVSQNDADRVISSIQAAGPNNSNLKKHKAEVVSGDSTFKTKDNLSAKPPLKPAKFANLPSAPSVKSKNGKTTENDKSPIVKENADRKRSNKIK